MNNKTKIITSIFIIIIIILSIALGLLIHYLIRKSKQLNPNTHKFPFKDGDIIELSSIINNSTLSHSNNNYPIPAPLAYSFYNWMAVSNSQSIHGQCNTSFQSMNININNLKDNMQFKIEYGTDGNSFALYSNNLGAYLSILPPLVTDSQNVRPQNVNRIGYSNTRDDSIWFDLQTNKDGTYNIISIKESKSLGLILLFGYDNNQYYKCYQGTTNLNSNITDVSFGIMLGVMSNPVQTIYINDITNPFPPILYSKLPFNKPTNVTLTINGSYLYYCDSAKCVVSGGNQSTSIWSFEPSSDGLAFSLKFDNIYIKPNIEINPIYPLSVSYATLVYDGNIPSPYPNDYTNWFTLKDNKIISLKTNLSFYLETNTDLRQCGGVWTQVLYGTIFDKGSSIEIKEITS